MDQLISLYDQFLHLFPDNWHTGVSVAILILMVMAVLRYLKEGLIVIILLLVFVPASIPVLRTIGLAIIQFAEHILGSK